MKHSAGRLVAAAMLLAAIGAVQAAPPTQPGKGARQSRAFSDDFSTDSRPKYAIDGKVEWHPGVVTLGPGSSVGRQTWHCHAMEMSLDLDWPPPEQGKTASVRIEFALCDNRSVSIEVSRGIRGGKIESEVRFAQSAGSGATTIRRVTGLPDPAGRPLRVSGRNGLLYVGEEKDPLAVGHCGFDGWRIEGWRLHAKGSGIACQRVATTSTRLTAQEHKKLQRARNLNFQIHGLYGAGKPRQALPLAEEYLGICRGILGTDHPDTATGFFDLAKLYRALGQYSKAEPCYLAAMEIHKRIFGEESEQYANSLTCLGLLYRDTGDYAKAELLYLKAAEIHKRASGGTSRGYADSLNALGLLYGEMGEHAMAERLFRRALDVMREAVGQSHPSYVTVLNNLGLEYKWQGEYAKAEPLLLRALELRKALLGEAHPDYAGSLINLASLYESMGDSAKAEPLFLKARDILKEVYGEAHPDYALSLNNLAWFYSSTKQYAKAEPLYAEALEIWEKAGLQKHPYYLDCLGNLGSLYCSMRQYDKAEPLLISALEAKRTLLGESHPSYAESLGSLAMLYHGRGEYSKAEPLLLKAVDIFKKTLGEAHPNYVQALFRLAMVCFAQGEHRRAVEYLERAADAEHRLATATYAGISEAQALNFAAGALGPPNALLSVWPKTDRPGGDLYARIWRRRRLIDRVVGSRQRALLAIDDPAARKLHEDYVQTRRTLGRLALAPAEPDPERLARRRRRLSELTERKEHLEQQLAALLPEFRSQLETQDRPYTELVKCLPPGAVFIDLIQYIRVEHTANQWRWTPSYDAFLLRPGQRVVRVELGAAQPINQAVAAWRSDIQSGRPGDAAGQLRRLLWEPIEKCLPSGTTTVYVCPDGALSRVPWPALPGRSRGTVLLQEGYAFAVVPHGPFLLDQLAHRPPSAESKGMLLAVGDVDYDAKPQRTAHVSDVATREVVRGEKRGLWRDLPGTKTELEAVLATAGKRDVSKLTGARASTAEVLYELPKARWAHLATHGFFADARFRSVFQLDENVFQQGFSDFYGQRTGIAGRNPLVLSGMVLAGANLPRQKDDLGIPQGDGGILCAEAIAGLPLGKLELVVLSGCETGLGDVAGGEGVFGLQRAFHMAGARNVIASLWKVDDNATAALMKLFYHKLWKENEPPIVALREAQLFLYQNPDEIDRIARSRNSDLTQTTPLPAAEPAKPAKPAKSRSSAAGTRHWAAFVLSGSGY